MYYLTVSVGQKSKRWLNWALWLGGSHKAAVKMSAVAASISKFNWGRFCFQVHSHGHWQKSSLPGCWLEAAQCLTHGLLHKAAPNMAASCYQSKKPRRDGERLQARGKLVFSNLIPSLLLYYTHYKWGQPTLWRRLCQGTYRKVRAWGPVRSFLVHPNT